MTKMIDIGDLPREVFNGQLVDMAKTVRFTTAGDALATADPNVFTFVFSDESVDRYGDVIHARGWDLRNFQANPIALFGHDANSVENVVGRAKNVRVQGSQLIGDIEFMGADVNPNAGIVRQMVAGGFLKTVSVGFAPVEWQATKDKSRPPGGVDFVKQELLEISIVPIPANPNALIQAKAAGIEVDRIELLPLEREEVVSESGVKVLRYKRADFSRAIPPANRDAGPKVTRRGLYSVSFLASILADLGYLQDSVAWEAENEGDGSPVPAALMDAMKALGQVLINMTAEEVAELVAGDDDDSLGVMSMGAGVSLKRDALQLLVRLDEPKMAGVIGVMQHLHAGRSVLAKVEAAPAFVPIVRQGKVLSSKNEAKLQEAHEHMCAATECVKGILEPETKDDTADEEEAKALRQRKAAALRRKLAHNNG